jgi:hypothetical protein
MVAWLAVLVATCAVPVRAQMIDDGLLVPRKALFTEFSYGHDGWSDYWEGTLKRENGNVGNLTTQSVTWRLTYGVTSRLNLMAVLPWVSTKASGGTLQPQSGLQDLTVAAKYCALGTDFGGSGHSLHAFVVAAYGTPVTDYGADLLPLSIGLHSQRFSGRATLSYMVGSWFADATGAYTLRGNVTLDRPSYFTDGQLFLTDEVAMPDVFDYTLRAGYMKGRWMVPVAYSQQNTLGGGDIRRQDMPFVSNKMDFSKLDGMVMYTLPKPANLAVKLEAIRTLTGRNVGQSTTLVGGLTYTVHF